MLKHFVMNSDKVNAVAVGWRGFSAIGVTKGALDQLNDDELEAVIAHEYGHLNQYHIPMKMVLGGTAAALRHSKNKDVKAIGTLLRYFALPIMSYITERCADRYSKNLGYGPALASAFTKLPQPKKYQLVLATLGGNVHPSTPSRIERASK